MEATEENSVDEMSDVISVEAPSSAVHTSFVPMSANSQRLPALPEEECSDGQRPQAECSAKSASLPISQEGRPANGPPLCLTFQSYQSPEDSAGSCATVTVEDEIINSVPEEKSTGMAPSCSGATVSDSKAANTERYQSHIFQRSVNSINKSFSALKQSFVKRKRGLMNERSTKNCMSMPDAPSTWAIMENTCLDGSDGIELKNMTAGTNYEDNPGNSIDPGPEIHHHKDYQYWGATKSKRKKLWQLNYKEAAVFLEEGRTYDKFKTHPCSRDTVPDFEVAHNRWFYLLDLVAAIAIMLLTFCETPAVYPLSVPITVHGSLELVCLVLLSVELVIRYRWLRMRIFLGQKRTVVKVILVLVMVIEAFVILVRQTIHLRITRALRPVFLIHSYHCRGLRRSIRQFLQSVPCVLDMLFLLLFFMLIFSILGFHMFSEISDDSYFQTFQDSFVSLFVLLTTANYPDVMMPAYAASPFYVVFYVIFLSLELFFLMNVLLAVVSEKFSTLEKAKLRNLFLHKRCACMHAFRLLVSTSDNQKLSLRHFVGMMQCFCPKRSRRDCYLMFKSLNRSCSGGLSLEEFYRVYAVAKLRWSLQRGKSKWFANFRHPFDRAFEGISRFVTWPYFKYFFYIVIVANVVWILVNTIQLSGGHSDDVSSTLWVSIMFNCVYIVEAVLKILGLGPKGYFKNSWNVFDFVVVLVSVIGLFGLLFTDSFYIFLILRPFSLLRLFKVKQHYQDVLGSMFVLFKSLLSTAGVIILIFYFFAIIGMELFLDYDLRNCCKNTSVESFYRYDNSSQPQGYYYLNNFDNVLVSGVTLFELTVVNNWFIIMDGYANAVSQWTRIYFMLFYIVMMVVMNSVVALILDSFKFRIEYKQRMKVENIEAAHGIYREEVTLSQEELTMCDTESSPLTASSMMDPAQIHVFQGKVTRSREDFSLLMYQDEVQTWIEEFNKSFLSTEDRKHHE